MKKSLLLFLFVLFGVTSISNVYADEAISEPTLFPCTEIPATNTPEPEFLGDINGDLSVNAEDALVVLKYAAKLINSDGFNGFLSRGDVDKSGELNANDALVILKFAAGIIKDFDNVNPVYTELPEEYFVINSGESKKVEILRAKDKAVFEFTPTESGYYRYHSSGDMLAEFGTINDDDGNLLVQRTDYAYIEYGWHPVFFDEFSFDFYFEADKKYYLEAFLNEYDTGSFNVYLMPLTEAEDVIIAGNEPVNCPYGTKKQLKVDYAPEYSIDFADNWESDNPDIVSVDENGVITGKGIGKANITVTTSKGLAYTVEIEVTDHEEIYVGDVKEHMSVFETEDYYKFVPETDGKYIIKSRRDRNWNTVCDVSISVYDSDFNEKLYSSSGINYDIECEFKAGEAYYLHIQSNAGDNGFTQFIEILNIDEEIE